MLWFFGEKLLCDEKLWEHLAPWHVPATAGNSETLSDCQMLQTQWMRSISAHPPLLPSSISTPLSSYVKWIHHLYTHSPFFQLRKPYSLLIVYINYIYQNNWKKSIILIYTVLYTHSTHTSKLFMFCLYPQHNWYLFYHVCLFVVSLVFLG